jgi:hypothetical protein
MGFVALLGNASMTMWEEGALIAAVCVSLFPFPIQKDSTDSIPSTGYEPPQSRCTLFPPTPWPVDILLQPLLGIDMAFHGSGLLGKLAGCHVPYVFEPYVGKTSKTYDPSCLCRNGGILSFVHIRFDSRRWLYPGSTVGYLAYDDGTSNVLDAIRDEGQGG